MAWGSTNKTKHNQKRCQQKHTFRIINFKDKLPHAKALLQSINALNIYQLNIFHIIFMHKVKNEETPQILELYFLQQTLNTNTIVSATNIFKASL